MELMLATTGTPKKKGTVKRLTSAPVNLLAIDSEDRPYTGADVIALRRNSNYQLNDADVLFALCIKTNSQYNAISRLDKLDYDLEMLIRLYHRFPSYNPWRKLSASEAFTLIYGDLLSEFRATPYEDAARLALFRRFTAACGRSLYTAYRWLGSGKSGHEGTSRRIEKILSKLQVVDNPRAIFEEIAKLMHRVRGLDLDKIAPLPTLSNPPEPKRRGPIPKIKQINAPGRKTKG
jgi:hypothetical protein